MPTAPSDDAWVKPFRRQARISTAVGWNLVNSRGRMRLQVREDGQPVQTVTLPYP
jgi:hypothetical protein